MTINSAPPLASHMLGMNPSIFTAGHGADDDFNPGDC
jgi:hypothetical protein